MEIYRVTHKLDDGELKRFTARGEHWTVQDLLHHFNVVSIVYVIPDETEILVYGFREPSL